MQNQSELFKKRARFDENLSELGGLHLPDRVENDTLLNREEALRTNEAWLSQLPALEIGGIQRNGGLIRSRTGGDLAQD